MEYLIAKWLHVLSSTVLFGTGIGTAWYLLMTSLSRDARAVALVARHVVIADWLFTGTTIVFQPLSGVYLAHLARIPLTTRWILWSFALYFVAAACWLPVVWLQIRMHRIAARAARNGKALPADYFRLLRIWIALGVPALSALLLTFYLMIAKPV